MTWWQQALAAAGGGICWLLVSTTIAIIFGRICQLRDQGGPQ